MEPAPRRLAGIALMVALGGTGVVRANIVSYALNANLLATQTNARASSLLEKTQLNATAFSGIANDGFGSVFQAFPRASATSASRALILNSYFSLTISANAGYALFPGLLSFQANAGDSWAGHEYFIRSSANNYATDLVAPTSLIYANPAPVTVSLSAAMFQNISQLTFRFYQVSSNPGAFPNDFRNITVSGTVDVPIVITAEPSTALIGAGLLLLAMAASRLKKKL